MMEFDNVVCLIGLPRSGTTIVSRLIGSQKRIQTLIEPYQSRRDSEYIENDPSKLCEDFELTVAPGSSILVKETATRPDNIRLISNLLEKSNSSGIRAAYIFVLRSPIESFLSQVEAVRTLWQKKSNLSCDKRSITAYWNSVRQSLKYYSEFAAQYHRRFILYDRFISEPVEEIGRAVALFGYPMDRSQLRLDNPAGDFGGDPKARATFPNLIADGDRFRIDEVARLRSDFAQLDEMKCMESMHEYLKYLTVSHRCSDEIVRDLALIAYRGFL
jgi:hypothetical protein